MAMRVERPLYGGGFATEAGIVHPFVLPGELIEIRDAGEVEVLNQAAERIAPGCVHFGVCGGCQYQQAQYGEQLRWKEEILLGLLGTAGIKSLPETEVHSNASWGYRNRIRLRVQLAGRKLHVGYSRRRTNEFLPVTMCPIAAPVLWQTVEALLWLWKNDPLAERWLEGVSEVEVFCAGDQSRLQIQFFLRRVEAAQQNEQEFAKFCECIREAMPQLAGAGAVMDPELGRRLRRAWKGAAWGAGGLLYEVAGRDYWVSRGAFFQVNRFLVGRLVELVTAGHGGELAWDLYAGVGLFSRVLAERFTRVVAVEGGEAASTDLARAARVKDGLNFRAVREGIVEFLRGAAVQRERPHRVVLDPPRAGLGREGCELLSRIGPGEIVYVSCDPVTLAGDLSVLTQRGYYVGKIDLVDLFPQTFHMETVVVLRRA